MKHYGCHDRKPFHEWLTVQNGYKQDGTRNMIEVPFVTNDVCNYTKTDAGRVDERCSGCKHKASHECA